MKRKILILSLSSLFAIFSATTTYAQCKSFTKKHCLSQLSPFVYNGQLNSAILTQGDKADLMLTFYPDQDYRVLICCDDAFGNVEFRLYNADKQLIYSNKDSDYLPYWDFSTNETMQLILRVIVPEKTDDQIAVKSGCVSILVGFKGNE